MTVTRVTRDLKVLMRVTFFAGRTAEVVHVVRYSLMFRARALLFYLYT